MATHLDPDDVQYLAAVPARPGVDAVPAKYVHLPSGDLAQWVLPHVGAGGRFEAYDGAEVDYVASAQEPE